MSLATNRITFANEALYVGPSPSTGYHFWGLRDASATVQGVAENQGSGNRITQLYRIQSASMNWNVNRVNVNQFGELAAIDRVILDPPTVNLQFSYLLANMYNESGLGFSTQGSLSAISGMLDKTQDDKNYFMRIAPEGQDAVGDTASNPSVFTYGIGNGFVNSYTTQASVGGFPSVDVGVEGMNMTFDTGISGWIPAIIPVNGARMTGFRYLLPTASGSPGTGYLDISVLRPGDITMSFRQRSAEDEGNQNAASSAYSTAGVSIDDAHIQSYNLSLSLGREQMRRLGSKFAFSREVTFPVDVKLSVNAIVTNITTGTISDFLTCDQAYDVSINIKRPACIGEPTPVIARYILRNAKLEGQSYSTSIGSNQTVSMNFGAQIGSARQTGVGLMMSGITSHVVV